MSENKTYSEVVIEVFNLFDNLLNLFGVFILNVFSHEIRTLEFFPTQRTQPFILGQFLCV